MQSLNTGMLSYLLTTVPPTKSKTIQQQPQHQTLQNWCKFRILTTSICVGCLILIVSQHIVFYSYWFRQQLPSPPSIAMMSPTECTTTVPHEEGELTHNWHTSSSSSPSSIMAATHSEYNITRSTEENYQSIQTVVFSETYQDVRKTLDYTYHSHYTMERQVLQDSIVTRLVQQKTQQQQQQQATNNTTRPNSWIVFTAGAMGAGKSYTIRHLANQNRFPLQHFVTVDPDEIRRLLPEFNWYLASPVTKTLAGELTRKEAGFIAELLIQVALLRNMNVLVDGSLQDWQWYQNYFTMLRNQQATLKIGILHITAPRDAIFERARIRSKITGRIVPRITLQESIDKVPKSVQILAPLVDFFAELHNAPNAPNVQLVSKHMTWQSFRNVWSSNSTTSSGWNIQSRL